MQISQLEYVLAVDKERNFVQAARNCHVTQPTLSIQIKKLEEELGVEIFDRSKQPILLTEKGAEILPHIRNVLKATSHLKAAASNTQNEIAGDFHLAVIPTLAPYLLPIFLKTFQDRYPKVNLVITERTTAEIISSLRQENIDCGLLATPLEENGISEFNLFYEPFYLYLNKHQPLAKKDGIEGADIHIDQLWLLEEGHCFRSQVLQLCGMRRKEPKNLKFQSGSIETLLRLTESSGGYTLVPHLALPSKDWMREKNSITKTFKSPQPAREVSLVYTRDVLKRAIIEALGQTITESLPEDIQKLRRKDFRAVPI